MLRCRADAEDAAQEALLRAWRSRAACRAHEDPEAWVRCIARHEAIRLATRDRRRGELAAEGAGAEPSHAPAVELTIDVVRAVRTLAPSDRALVALRYGADLSQPAVARALGVPEGTAKVRLHRVRRKLLTHLQDG